MQSRRGAIHTLFQTGRWGGWGIALGLLCLLSACSGGGTAAGLADATTPVAGAIHGASGYSLDVLPESYLGAAAQGEITLDVRRDGETTVVRVLGVGLMNQRAFYARLYCPAGVVLEEARAGTGLGAADDVLSLCQGEPGVVQLGAVLKHCDARPGVSGAAELARAVLRPGTAAVVREASGVPVQTLLSSKLWVNCTTRHLEWDARLKGDYNQDGVVNMSDLTPLAIYWGAAPVTYPDKIARYVQDSIQEVVDGNNDEQINIQDLSVLGMYLGQRIQGWNLYRSMDPATDFPDINLDNPGANGSAPSKIARFAYRAYGALAVGDAAHERQRFSIALPLLTDGMAYWVRPITGGMEGIPSNWSPYDASLVQEITAQVDPESYYGVTTGTLQFEVCTYDSIMVEGVLWARDVDALRNVSVSIHFNSTMYDYTPYGEEAAFADLAGEVRKLNDITEIPGQVLAASGVGVHNDVLDLSGTFRTWRVRLARGVQAGQTSPQPAGYGPSRGQRKHGLSFDTGTSTLSWRYAEVGDCNQNGVITTGDLVLVDIYWGTLDNNHNNELLDLIDANGNGLVEINDITVVAFNYGTASSGYNVYATTDPLLAPVDAHLYDDPGLTPIGYASFEAGAGDRAVELRRFSCALPALASGTYVWVQPEYRGDVGGVMQGDYIQIP